MVDVPTRKLRYFVTVAEELHFSRAASRHFIAQQTLSKQIRELEALVGAQLLERNTRSVRLTAAGERYLDAARAALAVLDAGVHDARRIDQGELGTINIGFTPGAALELTQFILDAFRQQRPQVEVELQETPLRDPTGGLRDPAIDVAFMRLPCDSRGVAWEPLFAERLVVATSQRHPLAARREVRAAELVNEPIAAARTGDEVWEAFWTLAELRGDGEAAKVRYTSSQTEELELVRAGIAISVTVSSVARLMPAPGVAYVPITDVPPSTVAIGWHAHRSSPLIELFVETAKAQRDANPSVVAELEALPPALAAAGDQAHI